MPKEKIYDEYNSIETQWAKGAPAVCVVVKSTLTEDPAVAEESAMWQCDDPDEIDRLIADLRRAKKQAWPQDADVDARRPLS